MCCGMAFVPQQEKLVAVNAMRMAGIFVTVRMMILSAPKADVSGKRMSRIFDYESLGTGARRRVNA